MQGNAPVYLAPHITARLTFPFLHVVLPVQMVPLRNPRFI